MELLLPNKQLIINISNLLCENTNKICFDTCVEILEYIDIIQYCCRISKKIYLLIIRAKQIHKDDMRLYWYGSNRRNETSLMFRDKKPNLPLFIFSNRGNITFRKFIENIFDVREKLNNRKTIAINYTGNMITDTSITIRLSLHRYEHGGYSYSSYDGLYLFPPSMFNYIYSTNIISNEITKRKWFSDKFHHYYDNNFDGELFYFKETYYICGLQIEYQRKSKNIYHNYKKYYISWKRRKTLKVSKYSRDSHYRIRSNWANHDWDRYECRNGFII